MKMNFGKLLATISMLLGMSIGTQAAVYYVKTNGNDNNNGSSVALAKATIQAALNIASSGDEIRVETGIYAIDSAIVLKEGVTLLGGYNIGMIVRNPLVTPTTIDGRSDTRLIYQATNFTTGSTTVIDGFIFQNGLLSGDNVQGAGAYLRNQITLRGCIFKDNVINGRNAQGAGVYVAGVNNRIISCTFDNNSIAATLWDKGYSSGKGAGLYVESGNNRLWNCVFSNNSIANTHSENIYTAIGAGLYSGSRNSIGYCTITQNQIANAGKGSSMGGGAYTLAQTVVDTCTISKNQIIKTGALSGSTAQGGGIHLNSGRLRYSTISGNTITYTASEAAVGTYSSGDNGGAGVFTNFSSTLLGNTIRRNSFTYSASLPTGSTLNVNQVGGGGIFCNGSYANITNNVVTDNVLSENITGATVGSKNGGGGGIYAVNIGSTSIDSCIAINNTANGANIGKGGALYLINATQEGTIKAVNCDIRNNSANIGGGVYAKEASVVSSLIANNTATTYGGGAYMASISELITCSVVRNSAPVNGGGSIYNEAGSTNKLQGTAIWGNDSGIAPAPASVPFTALYSAIEGLSFSSTTILLNQNNDGSDGPKFVAPNTNYGRSTNGADSTNTMNANWQLQSASPLFDKGDNDDLLPTYDLLHNPRVCGVRADIGAFEYKTTTCVAVPPTPPFKPQITWDSVLSTLTYGKQLTLNARISLGTITYISSNENIAKITGSTITAAGVGVVEIIAQETGNEWNFVQQTLTVTPCAITVTAENQTRTVNIPDPALTYMITAGSLVSGDQFTGELVRVPGDTIGAYEIKQGTLTPGDNYETTFIGSYFVITDERPHGSKVYYVSPNGIDSNTGTSWGAAKASIQTALTIASKENPKASVWIAAGTYTTSRPIVMMDGVNVYGGFRGTEDNLSQRPPVAVGNTSLPGLTIINGGSTTPLATQPYPFTTPTTWDGITFINGKNSDNGGGVVLRFNGELNQCNVAQCHSLGLGGGVMCIQGGSINKSYIAHNRADKDGGGIYSYMTLIDSCVVDSNRAGGNGGGIFATYKTVVSESAITHNTSANHGGGVYGGNASVLTTCVVSDNFSTSGNGGGAYGDGRLEIYYTSLERNIANMGGGLYLREGGIAGFCDINNNMTRSNGAGIYFYNGGVVSHSNVINNAANDNGGGAFFSQKETGTLRNSTVQGNSATNGGGLYFDNNGTAISCFINQNTSRENGGGLYFNQTGRCDSSEINYNSGVSGGGAYVRLAGTISRGSIMYNTATENGGGAFLNKPATVNENLVACNTSTKDGGGIYSSSESKIIRNRFINNVAEGNGGGIYCDKNNSVFMNLMANNSAANGGGIYAKTGNNIINATMVRNKATEYGGGIHYTSGNKMVNSVVWGNNTQVYINGASHSINYSAVEIDTIKKDSIAGTGNMKLSYDNIWGKNPPRFKSTTQFIGASNVPSDINYALTANWSMLQGAVCINHGSNEAIPQGYIFDVIGMPRIYDQIVDIGAYEWVPNGYTEVIKTRANVEEARIYPNPTSGEVTISTSFEGKSVQVYSLSGSLLYSAPFNGSSMNLNAMPNGSLIIRVMGEGKVAVGRVVKVEI